MNNIDVRKYKLSIAPMLDWTDKHYRYFMRQITKETLLYTEMITANAIIHGDRNKLLNFSEIEKPLVLQLAGDNPQNLAESCKIAESYGYTEINLNIGCPSPRVQNGNFGACLMATPNIVAKCFEEMQNAVNIPITVKNRIGIDGRETYEELVEFISTVSNAGCKKFIVHARIAILKGLDPKENRSVPPLKYDSVYRLKSEFPHLIIDINGGIKTLEDASEHLKYVDGVMIGRQAYEKPYMFALADSLILGESKNIPSRREIIENMIPYIEKCEKNGIMARYVIMHMLGLFTNQKGSKAWKRFLSENMHDKTKLGSKILSDVIKLLPQDVLDNDF